MMSSIARARAIKKAVKNFVYNPHGISVLRSEILKEIQGTGLDGRGICNTFVPVGLNNPTYQRGLSGLETLATLMEVDPSLSSALVFSSLEIAGEPSHEIISALRESLPSTVRLSTVLSRSYTLQKATEDFGL